MESEQVMRVLSRAHELPLRGRSAEVRKVYGSLQSAQDFGSVLFTFEGTPGAGRSRMLHEAGHIAKSLGATVVNGLPRGDEPRDRPLAVLLDDIHCTGQEEASTLVALRDRHLDTPLVWFVARRARWPNGPVDSILNALTSHHEQVALAPLPESAARELAADLLGVEPDAAFERALSDAGGQPQTLRALVEGLHEEGWVEIGATARLIAPIVPERVSGLVQRLLHDCSDFCRRMLSVAAVLDRRIVFEELATVLETTPSGLLSAFDEAASTGLVRSDGGHLTFAGELFRRVMYESMPVTVRTALRRQAEEQRARHARILIPARSSADGMRNGVPDGRPVHVERWQRHRRPGLEPRGQHPARLLAPAGEPGASTARAAAPVTKPEEAVRPAKAQREETADAGAELRPQAGWEQLTDRQRTVVELAVQGLTNRQIAERIFVSPHTVNYHLRKIYRALSVSSRIDLFRLAHNHATAAGVPLAERPDV
ncbi:helix-turn-helix transcriptional regulator [Streptomyces sp. MnatMP-M17]|uniref:helix-turn-helix transcriptional regulator n=2 Tax=unclassified Streptomyces TaxID=2593676 RepID=UPI0021088E2B|nr:helix-turn-helix transcriptional regulator [Streptomyces sp. MnatMP-M17]